VDLCTTEPYLAQAKDGALLAFFGQATRSTDPGKAPPANLFFSVSRDQGASFSVTPIHAQSGPADGKAATSTSDWLSGPSPSVDPKTGNMYVTWEELGDGVPRILFERSTDNGVTWGQPVKVNDVDPPLPFDEGCFDLVFASSVFTHLDPSAQREWLSEVRRVLKPGGLALLSIQGPMAREWFQRFCKNSNSPEFSQRLRAMLARDSAEAVFEPYTRSRWNRPEFTGIGSSYGLTFNGHAQVRRTWSQIIEVAAILPGAINGFQDIVVLRRTGDSATTPAAVDASASGGTA